MNILILEDAHLLSGENLNVVLKTILEARGHTVEIFDGRTEEGIEILDPLAAGAIVYQRLCDLSATGFVIDLQFFDQPDYGRLLWNHLREMGLPKDFKAIVYSQLVGQEDVDMYAATMGIPAGSILPRKSTPIDEVVDEFPP